MAKQKNGMRLSERIAPGVSSLFSSLLCIVIGLVIGYLALLLLGGITMAQNAAKTGAEFKFSDLLSTTWDRGFKAILQGGFFKTGNTGGTGVRSELLQAAPLIMTGLSVAFAFKTGLFNIGAAGQYTVGAYFAMYCAIILKMPWWLCLLAAAVGGAIWGAIPGIFKAFLNVNEVITSIMFNWIGLYAVNTLIYQGGNGPMYFIKTAKTYTIKQASPKSLIPSFNIKVPNVPDLKDTGTLGDWAAYLRSGKLFDFETGWKDYFLKVLGEPSIGIFIAIAIAIIVWFVLNKTTFGYELKACGHNKHAARYAGINDKKNIILSMTIAGALAGLGAGLVYLSDTVQWMPQEATSLPAAGFNGISVALLASSNPIGAIFSAVFISHITTGGGFMNKMIFPGEVAEIISGVVIYLCAFSLLFRNVIVKIIVPRKRAAKVAQMNMQSTETVVAAAPQISEQKEPEVTEAPEAPAVQGEETGKECEE